MDTVEEIGREKKKLGINHAIDIPRRNAMIKDRQNQAPQGKKGKVGKLFREIHDISVRIQTHIIDHHD